MAVLYEYDRFQSYLFELEAALARVGDEHHPVAAGDEIAVLAPFLLVSLDTDVSDSSFVGAL